MKILLHIIIKLSMSFCGLKHSKEKQRTLEHKHWAIMAANLISNKLLYLKSTLCGYNRQRGDSPSKQAHTGQDFIYLESLQSKLLRIKMEFST